MSQGLQTQVKTTQKPSAKKAKEKRLQPEPSRPFAGECSACRREKGILQRATHGPSPNKVPPIVHEVFRSPRQTLDAETRGFTEAGSAYDFSQMPTYSKSPKNVQAKLTVNTPGDIYEQEADRIADQAISSADTYQD